MATLSHEPVRIIMLARGAQENQEQLHRIFTELHTLRGNLTEQHKALRIWLGNQINLARRQLEKTLAALNRAQEAQVLHDQL